MIQLPNTTGTGINLGLANVYATPSFTVAAWVRRAGTGTTISTGTGGHAAIEPIFTAGIGESETLGLNCAWFLGWIPSTSRIGLDFEDWFSGLNHIATSSATLVNNTDYHLCATYNYSSSFNTGSWALYINGVLDATTDVTSSTLTVRTPDTSSTQGVGIGVAITSTAVRSGAWLGTISEVAVWSSVLSPAAVFQLAKGSLKGMPTQINSSSLQGYWPLDHTVEGGTVSTTAGAVLDKSGRNRNGTAFGTIVGKAETVLSYR
jgi:hypothetical protein